MTKVEKSIEYLFYLLVLLYFVGKVFKPITLIIDILFLYLIFQKENREIVMSFYDQYKKLILAFGTFIGYLIFQSIFLEMKYYTFKSSFETIMYIILVFAALYIFVSKVQIRKLIYVSYFILFILFLDSLYQYIVGVDVFGYAMWGDGSRLTAWNKKPMVNLMMGQFFGLLIAAIFIFEGKLKKIAIAAFLLCSVLFIFAGNRSPILALFTSVFIIILLSKKRKYFIGVGIIFLFIMISAVSLNERLSNGYSKLLNPTSNQATSGRLPIIDTGIEIFKDHSLFGIGSHNYKHYHNEYFPKIDKTKYPGDPILETWSRITPSHIHSVGLDILISYGLLGVLIFGYVLYQIYNYFIKNNEIGLFASLGFLYCITPLQFGRSFTMGDWQFITYLGLVFLVLLSQYKRLPTRKLEIK